MLTGVRLHKAFAGSLSSCELSLEKFDLLCAVYSDVNLFCQVARSALPSVKEAKDLLKQHFYRDQVQESFLYHLICCFAACGKIDKALLLVD